MKKHEDGMFSRIPVEKAVGKVLSHDVTEIRPGEFKGAAFKKGHRIAEADVCHLQRLGKRHIYVLEVPDGCLHEDDAAVAMAEAFAGPGVGWSGEPREGKIRLAATRDGLLYVDPDALFDINLLGEVMCATRHTRTVVATGDVVAATRAIPLVVEKRVVDLAVNIAAGAGGLLRVAEMRKPKAGAVITGNEVYTGLIEDRFEPVLRRKIDRFGGTCVGVAFAPDDPEDIAGQVRGLLDRGADLILTTGGMSVDPDDTTRAGIQRAGAGEFVYGSAVLPGAMFMLAHVGDVPVLGVPACGIFHETTVLDLILPRVLAGERITREDIARLGHGGMCLDCPECRFPDCPFGKG
ncbi:MAG: molybdopterin-binding protein [Desulfatibacillaceae bacterium]